MRRIAVFLIVALAGANAQAAPRKIGDCEAIEEPLAYNACLASFGPTRGRHAPAVGARVDDRENARPHGRFEGGAGWVPRRGRVGRMHMELTPRH